MRTTKTRNGVGQPWSRFSEVNAAQAEIESLKSQLERASSSVGEQKEDLRGQLEALSKEKEDLSARAVDLAQENETMRSSFTELEEERNALQGQLAEAKDIQARLESQIAELESGGDALQAATQAHAVELEALESKLNEKDAAIQELKESAEEQRSCSRLWVIKWRL